jgi:hypothetical protein
MNIYTSILFLQDFQTDPHEIDDRGRAFAQGYGNRIASAQAFPPLGHAIFERNNDAFAEDLCTAGACG